MEVDLRIVTPDADCVNTAVSADGTTNLRTDIMYIRGFDLNIVLILRGGILMPIGDFLEGLSQAILVGVMLVGRLCICTYIYIYTYYLSLSLYIYIITLQT